MFLTDSEFEENQFPDIPATDINFSFDSENRKLTIPTTAFMNTDLPNYDSLKLSLDNLANDLDNFKFALTSSENGIKLLFEGNDGIKRENVEIDINFDKLGEFIANTVSAATAASATDWDDFGAKMDSLSRALTALEKDSTAFIKLKQASEEIKKAKNIMPKKKNN
jgi:hypothetical protein